jgi:transposase-like protein
VLGGIDRETKECFMVPVDRRDAATLLPIIQQFVHPGTRIFTDEWRSYHNLPQLGFGHNTVNHSLHVVDPHDAEIHTNRVEGMWSNVKRMSGTRKEGPLLDTYLQEFMWMQQFGNEPFHNLVNHIIEQYNV